MDFSSFLKDFIERHKITNGKLADQLQVPSATISHLLSGRNKPSLDFIQKLISNYPTLDLYEITGLSKYNISNKSEEKEIKKNEKEQPNLFSQNSSKNKKVKKVVLLYEDNTFEEYNY